MLVGLALLCGLGLWWLSRNPGAAGRLAAGLPLQRLAAWAALALAGLLTLRGSILPAAGLGLLGLWMLEGAEGLGRRVRGYVSRGAGAGRRRRTALIEVLVHPDGSLSEGRVVAGPAAGTSLDRLGPAEAAALMRQCRERDLEGARLLEAYLHGRAAGWGVDAEADRDPRAGGPAQPGALTQEEAYQVLGLERGATTEQIRAAHRGLMKRAHPDQGGSAERAARLNAARDRLLNRHR